MQSDNHLIRKIKKKQNKEAAGLLIERYYREIYAYTYRQVACKELAMDLTQEIFILVLKGIRAFDEKKGSFRTWIYRIASNKITDYYRSLTYRKSQLEEPYGQEYEHTGVSPDISSQVLRQETIREVMAVIVRYDEPWIQIFQKHCFEEQTFAEIAEELKLSEGTVKTRYYKMLAQIRKEVADNE